MSDETNKESVGAPTGPTLNGQAISQDQLQEKQKELPNNQRIREIKPGEFRVLSRLNG